jgi:hypothetical protein
VGMDRVGGVEVEETEGGSAERPPSPDRPPLDRPGAEAVASRADSREGAIAAGGRESGAVGEAYVERLDVPIGEGQPTPREVLERFAPADAGLVEVTVEEAAEYIDRNAEQRPWLAPARDCEPSVQRVLVAMDQGRGACAGAS